MKLTIDATPILATEDPDRIGRLLSTWVLLSYGDPRDNFDRRSDWTLVEAENPRLKDLLLGDNFGDLTYQHLVHDETGIEMLYCFDGDLEVLFNFEGDNPFTLSSGKGLCSSGWFNHRRK